MIKRYLVTAAVFLAIDLLWLGLVAPKLYKQHLGHLMAEKTNFLAAGVFYLLYVAALLVFVINPAIASGSVWQALLKGAFLGLVMYATYDLTNLATLMDWPLNITLIDLLWGSFVTAATSGIATRIFL
ncbi:MAG: DUF2177 family protein [Clostridiales bacterium]|nr:DUF2177 family protein [Clostridiales bacterium]